MSARESQGSKVAGQKILARALKDRRRFRRIRLAISGRVYIPATQEEANCTVENISPGGVSVRCDLQQDPKGQAVIYFDKLGRFEGPIVRAKNGSFGIQFTCSAQRRENLADRLTLELNRHLLSERDLRGFGRTKAPAGASTQFTRSTGEQVVCQIIDLSPTGVSVRTKLKPALGEHVLIGNRAGRIARYHREGIGIEYLGSAADAPSDRATVQDSSAAAPAQERPSAPAVVAIAVRS